MTLPETPSQTAGPYLHIGLLPSGLAPLTRAVAAPELILEGRVFDGAGEPLRDALLELWDASTGQWLRSATDAETGLYHFAARRPAGWFNLFLLARGINLGLHTRAYLEPHASLAAFGPRAATLQAQPRTGADLPLWRFDIHLQGDAETVFLDV